MILVGATYSNNMVFIMAFILFSLGNIAMIQTHHNLNGLTILDVYVDSGFAESQSRVTFRVQTQKKKSFFALTLEQKGLEAIADVIEADRINLVTGHIQFSKRGKYKLNRVKVKTVFPYGLFVAWQWHTVQAEYFVYPKPFGSLTPQSSTLVEGDDFSGLKRYRDGDSLKHVDWKAVSRGRPMMIKEFNEGVPSTQIFDISSIPIINPEEKLSQLSQWVSDAFKERNSFGLILGDRRIHASNGREHLHRCLSELAKYESKHVAS